MGRRATVVARRLFARRSSRAEAHCDGVGAAEGGDAEAGRRGDPGGAGDAARRYVGAYVYARPDLGDPVSQADHFLRHARFSHDVRTLVPFVDLEWPYAGVATGPCYNLNPTQLRAWIHAFVDRIEASIHRKPMIYTNVYWWNPCTGNDPSFGGYPLDVANYYPNATPTLPAGWTTFALWQYRPGNPENSSDHDRDVVNGGMTGLSALAGHR